MFLAIAKAFLLLYKLVKIRSRDIQCVEKLVVQLDSTCVIGKIYISISHIKGMLVVRKPFKVILHRSLCGIYTSVKSLDTFKHTFGEYNLGLLQGTVPSKYVNNLLVFVS